jgi:hypothetical protein
MEYVDLIKGLIKGHMAEIKGKSVDRHYFDHKLYPLVKEHIPYVARLNGLQEVSEEHIIQYFGTAVNEYLSNHPIDVDRPSSLVKKGYQTWMTKARQEEIKWGYTDRYIRLLKQKGRAERIVKNVAESSLDIVGKMGDPRASNFYSKGLVVGSVQSGKTENFNGVINRAIDSGYRLIIVLSGIMDDLRVQTQKRLEEDVVGEGVIDENLNTNGKKGVGKIVNFSPEEGMGVEQIQSITSYKSDFNKSLADAHFNVNFLNILVCKKNVGILKNLIIWLNDNLPEGTTSHRIPMLIVDDEADNASLNNMGAKGRAYASKINGHIRALLAMFDKKTYLGYTATPFANVLQDRNEAPDEAWRISSRVNGKDVEREFSQVPNLFPDDFIVLLKSPSNYVGAKNIFETLTPLDNESGQKIPLLEVVTDFEKEFPSRVWHGSGEELEGITNCKTKEEFYRSNLLNIFDNYQHYRSETRASSRDDGFPRELPMSLKDAIACFIISVAIRESRRPKMQHSAFFNPHNTMLVHISRFIPWQNKTKELIIQYLNELKPRLLSDNKKDEDSIYAHFERIWYKYYADIIESIQSHLPRDYEDSFMAPLSFASVVNLLLNAADSIEVKALNSRVNDKLKYDKKYPATVIAVGGNTLSRGFTLEGLTINYFIRTVNYSDTLLQMGRWFGYKPGYLDCCKIFTTEDTIDNFDLTTKTIEELEAEFRKMEYKLKTPSNFVLHVRKHPGTLKVTRPSILKNAVSVKWSYQDHLIQTSKFSITRSVIADEWKYFKDNVVSKHDFEYNNKSGFMVSEKIDVPDVVEILNSLRNFDEQTKPGLIKFLQKCDRIGKLKNWTIAIKAKGDAGELSATKSGLPCDMQMAVRRGPSDKNKLLRQEFLERYIFRASGRSANIISGGLDLAVLLTEDEILQAETQFRSDQKEVYLRKNKEAEEKEAEDYANRINVPERVYRERITDDQGIMLIYLIDAAYVFRTKENDGDTALEDMAKRESIDINMPLVGYALGIPPIDPDPGGEYLKGDYDIHDEDGDLGVEQEDQNEEDSEIPNDTVLDD